jgi:hypothetical protein
VFQSEFGDGRCAPVAGEGQIIKRRVRDLGRASNVEEYGLEEEIANARDGFLGRSFKKEKMGDCGGRRATIWRKRGGGGSIGVVGRCVEQWRRGLLCIFLAWS